MFTLLGLLWDLTPISGSYSIINAATLFYAFSLIFYFRLDLIAGILMLIFGGLQLAVLSFLEDKIPLWEVCLGGFILAWLGQFIGHKIEGKKPSFFEDIQFLLIGPLWVFNFFIRKF